MFGIFKKSKIVRSSDNLDNTKTKWFKGQKVKIKSGTSNTRSNYKNNLRDKNPTWFREIPLPVPNVEKKQMLISSRDGLSKVAILEGPTLVQYYTSENNKKSKVIICKIKDNSSEYDFQKVGGVVFDLIKNYDNADILMDSEANISKNNFLFSTN